MWSESQMTAALSTESARASFPKKGRVLFFLFQSSKTGHGGHSILWVHKARGRIGAENCVQGLETKANFLRFSMSKKGCPCMCVGGHACEWGVYAYTRLICTCVCMYKHVYICIHVNAVCVCVFWFSVLGPLPLSFLLGLSIYLSTYIPIYYLFS